MNPLTSYKGIIQDDKSDEKTVKASQSQQKSVESVPHLLPGQDDDGESVAQQSKQSDYQL